MTGQMSIYDVGTDPAGFVDCAQWCEAHPKATRWIVYETHRINDEEDRAVSMRLDIEPTLKRRAREWGLLDSKFSGIDHNLTAPLARYLMATRPGLRFRIRKAACDPVGVPNATPQV